MRHAVSAASLITLILFSSHFASGQDYVVTVTEDTLRGTLKIFNFGDGKKVQVTDGQKNKTQVPILKTRLYSYKGEIFNPIRTETGYQYMKLLTAGYLSLYAFIPDKQSNYDGRFLVKRDGKGMELPNLSFKRMMTKFLEDCPAVVMKIDNGDLAKRDLDKIIAEYNACIDNQSHALQAAIAQKTMSSKAISPWDALEGDIKAHSDFSSKSNALDMIAEIKGKIAKNEKVPNFLTEGLTNALADTDLKDRVAAILSKNP